MEGRYAGRCLGMWRALAAGEGSHPAGSSSKDLFPSDRPHSDSARLHHKHSALNRQTPKADEGGALLIPWICYWHSQAMQPGQPKSQLSLGGKLYSDHSVMTDGSNKANGSNCV